MNRPTRLLAAALALGCALPRAAAAQATAVATTLTAAGASNAFYPNPKQGFHVQLSGAAAATCYLERILDGSSPNAAAANWTPVTVTANGTTTTLYNWSYAGSTLSEDVTESQYGVPYRVDCGAMLGSFGSGALVVGMSQ